MPKPSNTCTSEFLLGHLLKRVSRSFYLTLAVLPESSRTPISLAYLLARTADTIADTSLIASNDRLAHLKTLNSQLTVNADTSRLTLMIGALQNKNVNDSEHQLIQHLPEILALYQSCAEQDQRRITHVVSTLIRGMIFDLETFPSPDSGLIQALNNRQALDHYTYLVAGCVGEFWTEVCSAHEVSCQNWPVETQRERGIRLGKALQLTNILRDVPQDLRIGRCYLPDTELAACGLKPQDLLLTKNTHQAQPVFTRWVKEALDHFNAGSQYAMMLPRRAIRLRLAVFWPALIGLATLRRLTNNPNWLCPEGKIKVSRRWIYQMLIISIPLSLSNRLMQKWFHRLDAGIRAQLPSDPVDHSCHT